MHKRRLMALMVALTLTAASTPAARADGFFKYTAIGLAELGFSFVGTDNFLSGGEDLTIARNWSGETLDFGFNELTLSGPMVFNVSTGNRGLSTLDVSFNTNDTPLNYTLVSDTGSQLTTIDGSFLMDGTVSLNSFGWYDMNVLVSSRQDISYDGRFKTGDEESDFDYGPISVRGNLFADILAAVTDPIFTAIGAENIFASFSGAAQLDSALNSTLEAALAKANAGLPLSDAELAQLSAIAGNASLFGLSSADAEFVSRVLRESGAPETAATSVPEPASLILFGGAGVVVLMRRRR